MEYGTSYFEWMYDLVCLDQEHVKLLSYLDSIDFTYILPMDENREIDGEDLRQRFALEQGISYDDIPRLVRDGACSVLEMMVALALRCEESIMHDVEKGNRTYIWFWQMIQSLNIDMSDWFFDEDVAAEHIDIFLNRDYSPKGDGGLFYIESPKRDLRDVEIWYQMNWFLNEYIRKEGT